MLQEYTLYGKDEKVESFPLRARVSFIFIQFVAGRVGVNFKYPRVSLFLCFSFQCAASPPKETSGQGRLKIGEQSARLFVYILEIEKTHRDWFAIENPYFFCLFKTTTRFSLYYS